MPRLRLLSLAFAALLAPVALAQSPVAGDPARGKDYFERRCIKCHVKEGMGPPYVGIVGRKAGTVPGFDYSDALKASGLSWTEENLDKWLENPDVLVPGNLMGLKIRNPQLRADLVAYLKTRV
ncbi:MAG: c-type cytochrome [Betaproteobacteria bacterium]|nr:c-type cytochrome [Betaproteobacteria bacterium]